MFVFGIIGVRRLAFIDPPLVVEQDFHQDQRGSYKFLDQCAKRNALRPLTHGLDIDIQPVQVIFVILVRGIFKEEIKDLYRYNAKLIVMFTGHRSPKIEYTSVHLLDHRDRTGTYPRQINLTQNDLSQLRQFIQTGHP